MITAINITNKSVSFSSKYGKYDVSISIHSTNECLNLVEGHQLELI